ncbi:MAG: 2-oxoacid:ferredoxin oxidoreductase subunit beta [Nitrospirae bacterium]|nr:2-oxoacid:ferredoxin oxidoreductase subunit beta [Nitrospirota bacterium]
MSTLPNVPSSTAPAPALKLSRKDFQSDQEIRWCPGCGDYSILNAATTAFAQLGVPREKFVVVSGIGCSSRFPYYVNTYGFHGIHGRAPAIATGIALANPDLLVWVMTGDGDGLSIGGNHLLHAMRRNVNLKIVLFDNRIYGLTKGQYSPTSEFGKVNKSAPFGTVERPVDPILLALAAGATFVARSVDVYQKHMIEMLRRAALHKGAAFLHVFQNCPIYNDNAFTDFTEKEIRDDRNIELVHGQPLVFGKNKDQALRMGSGHRIEVVPMGSGARGSAVEREASRTRNNLSPTMEGRHDEASDVLHYDATDPATAYLLAGLKPPDFPMPIGVFRETQLPAYEELVHRQIRDITEKRGPGDLDRVFGSGDTWDVRD